MTQAPPALVPARPAAAPAAGGAGRAAEADGAGAAGAAGRGVALAREIERTAIARDPDQPRRQLDAAKLDLLAADLRARGIIEPVLVRPHPDAAAAAATPYMLVVGERRWLAAARAGLPTVPAVVRHDLADASERLMLQLAENDGDLRQELNLHERAVAVAQAFRLSALHQSAFARRHHRSPAWLSEMLALSRVEGVAAEALGEGRLPSVLAARTFLRLPAEHQLRLLAAARRDDVPITLAKTERAATRAEHSRPRPAEGASAAAGADPRQARQAGGRDGALAPPQVPGWAQSNFAADETGESTARIAGPSTSRPAGTLPADPTATPAAPAPPPAGAAPSLRGWPAATAPDALSGKSGASAAVAPTPATAPGAPPAPPALAPAPRSAAAGFLAAGEALAQGRGLPFPAADPAGAASSQRITLDLSPSQLVRLLVLLGLEPAGSPDHQVRQVLQRLGS